MVYIGNDVMCAGIDVDIDVEHEGQRAKVTPPTQGEGDVEMDGASSEGGTSQASKVSRCLLR